MLWYHLEGDLAFLQCHDHKGVLFLTVKPLLLDKDMGLKNLVHRNRF